MSAKCSCLPANFQSLTDSGQNVCVKEKKKQKKKRFFAQRLLKAEECDSLEHNAIQPAWTFRPANSNWY